MPLTEEERLRLAALAYVFDLHGEFTQGAPQLGTQNQAVDFILGDPELRRALAVWAVDAELKEGTRRVRRPAQDALYDRVRSYLEHIGGRRVFPTAEQLAR